MSQASSMGGGGSIMDIGGGGGSPAFGSAGWHAEHPILSAIGGAVKEGVTGGKQKSAAAERHKSEAELKERIQKKQDDLEFNRKTYSEEIEAFWQQLSQRGIVPYGASHNQLVPTQVQNVQDMAAKQDREAQAVGLIRDQQRGVASPPSPVRYN